MAPGEARKLAQDSAWTVSLVSSDLDAYPAIRAADQYAPEPAEGETFVVGTFTVVVDGAAIAAQGADIANEGVDVGSSLSYSYVTAAGKSYDGSSGTWCYTGNPMSSQGMLYADGASVTADACVAVPTAEVPGGVWRVANSQNDGVFIATS